MVSETELKENGFENLENGFYHRMINEVHVMADSGQEKLTLYARCASVTVDNENEIEKYVACQAEKHRGIGAGFRNRRLYVDILPQEGQDESRLLGEAAEVMEDTIRHFDMLPVCAGCGRVQPVELIFADGRPTELCSVCKGEADFEKHKENILEQQRKRYEDEYSVAGIQKRPVKAAIKAGFLGGLYTCIAGFVYMLFFWVFLGNFVHLFFGFLGAVGGFFTVRKINRISHIPGWQKVLLSAASAFLTILVLSNITFIVLNHLIFHGEFLDMFSLNLFDLGSPISYMIVFGIGSFFLSEWIFGFMFPGNSR